jgi:hypothetical protein
MGTTSNLLTFRGRLPGVVCEAALPPTAVEPLRLDVAAFVGFAERGPLDLPVALEDPAQYQEVFGQDLLLARTRTGGQVVYAALPSAVKAFFDNGGTRCYVVRVAGDNARPNRFRMPALVAWDDDAQTFRTVSAQAAWAGRWSDNMGVGTQLRSLPLHLQDNNPLLWTESEMLSGVIFNLELHLELPLATTLAQNDLLRLQFDGPGRPLLYCFVTSAVRTGNPATTARGIPITIHASAIPDFLFAREPVGALPTPTFVERLTDSGWVSLITFPAATIPDLNASSKGEYVLSFPGAETINITPGDVLRVYCANGGALFFPVEDVVLPQHVQGSASPPVDTSPPSSEPAFQLVSRSACWQFPAASPPAMVTSSPPGLSSPPANLYGNLVEVDLLTFDLYMREGSEIKEVWQGLQFAGEQRFDAVPDKYWINLLVPSPGDLQANAPLLASSQRKVPGLDLTRSSRLGAPLPPPDRPDDPSLPGRWLYLPIGMGELPGPDEFAQALPDDPAQVIDSACPLPSKDGLVVFDPAALFLDSRLAQIGALDLMHEANRLLYLDPTAQDNPQPIYLRKLHSLLMVDEVALISIPDLVQRPWHCLDTVKDPQPAPPPPPTPPDWSHFQDCDRPPYVPVEPTLPTPPDSLQLPVMDDPKTYDMTGLLFVQRVMLNFCAARSDVVAILSLPLHFKKREALDWQRRFIARPGDFLDSGLPTDILAYVDDTMLSYAAVYHPWLQIREEATPQRALLRAMPPNGAVCGMIAAREHARGPWIAPTSLPLMGIVGLSPAFSATDWADLFNAHFNIVRQPTVDFTLLSAHTLSADSQFLQLSVRRLLIFLRKLALRRGMRYVFESNTLRFRQAVQASFEQTLSVLLSLGAITAYQVLTGPEINTQNDYDNGRFLIALKIAPSQPIEFITVVLLRAGEGLLEALEG